jgi:hypothetical protein
MPRVLHISLHKLPGCAEKQMLTHDMGPGVKECQGISKIVSVNLERREAV